MQKEKNKFHVQFNLDIVIEYSIVAMVFFLALSPVLATVFLVTGSVAWIIKLIQSRGTIFKRTSFDIPIMIFVILSALSILVSPDKGFSFYNYYNLIGRYMLIYYLVVQNVSTMKQLKTLLGVMLFSSMWVTFYGYYQYVHGIDITSMRWVDGDQFPELKTRVFSTLQNPNILAGYLIVMMSLIFGVLCRIKTRNLKIVLSVCFILQGICLGLTYCRGAWISLALVIALYGIFHNRKIFVGLVLLGSCILFFDASITERLLSAFNASDTSSEMRLALWESTIAMIIDHPFFGIGWGTYWMIYPDYDFYINNPAVKIVHAHNMYLNYMAEIGIPGFLSFMACVLGHLNMAVVNSHLRTSNLLNGVVLGAVMSIICVMINGFTDYVLFNIELSMFFWLVNGLIVIICRKSLD